MTVTVYHKFHHLKEAFVLLDEDEGDEHREQRHCDHGEEEVLEEEEEQREGDG